MINTQVMKLLREKTGRGHSRLYEMIEEKKREFGYSITTDTAAYLIAGEKGIDISDHVSEDDLAKVSERSETRGSCCQR